MLLRLLGLLVRPPDLVLQLLVLLRELGDLALQPIDGALPALVLLPHLLFELLRALLQFPPLLRRLALLKELLALALGTLTDALPLLPQRGTLRVELGMKGAALGLDLLPHFFLLSCDVALRLLGLRLERLQLLSLALVLLHLLIEGRLLLDRMLRGCPRRQWRRIGRAWRPLALPRRSMCWRRRRLAAIERCVGIATFPMRMPLLCVPGNCPSASGCCALLPNTLASTEVRSDEV
mmetsp:Transcript_68360/g.221189  ORF Transcript_68360/g.221189 Transcript_68360/m.221189 type:complete len:236 (+) Transcript_68360:911-1618(+)